MATFTITTTPAQDAGIQRALDRFNADRAAQTPPLPAVTANQYVTGVIRAAFDSWKQQKDADDQAAVATAMNDPSKVAAIKAAAGVP